MKRVGKEEIHDDKVETTRGGNTAQIKDLGKFPK